MRAAPIVLAGALVAASLVASRPARAEPNGLEGLRALAYVAAAIVVVDAAVTGYDVVVAAKGERPAPGMCVAEVLAAAPQIPLGFAFATSSGRGERPLGLGFAAWTSVLVVHGVWGVVASAKHATAEPAAAGSSALVARASAPIGLHFGGAF
jgi:hypothetical protein